MLPRSRRVYTCKIFVHDYMFVEHEETRLGQKFAPVDYVTMIVVRARSPRQAAAKGYCLGVGRERLRKLQAMNAPQACINFEKDYAALAGWLSRTTLWIGDCYHFDNLVQAWYIQVERQPARRWSRRQRRLLRWLRIAHDS